MSAADRIAELTDQKARLEDSMQGLARQIAEAETALMKGDPEPRRLTALVSSLYEEQQQLNYELGRTDQRLEDALAAEKEEQAALELAAAEGRWQEKEAAEQPTNDADPLRRRYQEFMAKQKAKTAALARTAGLSRDSESEPEP